MILLTVAFPPSVEQKLDRPFSFSQWRYDRRATCLVRVTAEDGAYGWGEGYGPATVVAEGVRLLAPSLVGGNPLNQAALWQTMHARTLDYARSGVLSASLSAIDVALWDLKGKLLGQPVSVLLGGPRRERVQAYATGMYFTDGPDLAGRLGDEARRELTGFCEQTDYLDKKFVTEFMDQGRGSQVWFLLNLALWWKEYMQ